MLPTTGPLCTCSPATVPAAIRIRPTSTRRPATPGRCRILPATGHLSPLEIPETVAARIDEFVRELSPWSVPAARQ